MDLTPYLGLPEGIKVADPHRHTYTSYMPRAIELEQLHNCIKVAPQTVDYLYNQYTPTTTPYAPGTRPLLEQIVQKICEGCITDREKAVALLTWRRANYRHVGKCGLGSEEEVILSGYSMCHDASRTLITLCQVAGLGARMVLGLNDETFDGHTLTEVCIDGKWSLLDPSPCIPWPYYELADGSFASGHDIQQDPSIVTSAKGEWQDDNLAARVSTFFKDFRLVNYSLEESTRNMAQRFVRLVTAQKIVENYDYMGHLNHKPVSAYADLDGIVDDWFTGTMQVYDKAQQKLESEKASS